MQKADRAAQGGRIVCAWYEKNARDLPWRASTDPYRVLVSEIMLQQTRAETVAKRFGPFLARFENVAVLADASEDEVLKAWEGLGYYRRARNLHKAAQYLQKEHDGVLPADVTLLRAVPGIGDYTAAAVAAIAYGMSVVPVDANVLRIFSRLYAMEEPVDRSAARTKIADLARVWLGENVPGDFAQGLMDIGSSYCTPRRPRCEACPLLSLCEAGGSGMAEQYPVKTKPAGRREEDVTILILCTKDGRVALEKRPDGDLLAAMYGLPVRKGKWSEKKADAWAKASMGEEAAVQFLPERKHVFTHVTWHIRDILITGTPSENLAAKYLWVTAGELERAYALPSAFRPSAKRAFAVLVEKRP